MKSILTGKKNPLMELFITGYGRIMIKLTHASIVGNRKDASGR